MPNSTFLKEVITTTAMASLNLVSITSTASAAIFHTGTYNGSTDLLASSSIWWSGAKTEVISLREYPLMINDAGIYELVQNTYGGVSNLSFGVLKEVNSPQQPARIQEPRYLIALLLMGSYFLISRKRNI